MKRHWTADPHFSHANIVKYCKRPCIKKGDLKPDGTWASFDIALKVAEKHDTWLMARLNSRIKPGDDVINVGDFINYGNEKGVPGLKNKPDFYLSKLNGTWHMIEGNHDAQNNVKTIARNMFVMIAKQRVFVSHYPTESAAQDPDLMKWVHENCAYAICGHVHEKWDTKWCETSKSKSLLLNINVGVDAANWYSLTDSEVFNIYNAELKKLKV